MKDPQGAIDELVSLLASIGTMLDQALQDGRRGGVDIANMRNYWNNCKREKILEAMKKYGLQGDRYEEAQYPESPKRTPSRDPRLAGVQQRD